MITNVDPPSSVQINIPVEAGTLIEIGKNDHKVPIYAGFALKWLNYGREGEQLTQEKVEQIILNRGQILDIDKVPDANFEKAIEQMETYGRGADAAFVAQAHRRFYGVGDNDIAPGCLAVTANTKLPIPGKAIKPTENLSAEYIRARAEDAMLFINYGRVPNNWIDVETVEGIIQEKGRVFLPIFADLNYGSAKAEAKSGQVGTDAAVLATMYRDFYLEEANSR
jgi:hypothetical protein